ncbi:TerC family protein [Rhodopseudomonas telluris]|uniref:TerC family protein n=1 Tax=Rhodopseudomonas telluris TaxID=644215 RepID=A0ABV6EY41_9BRAD
MDWVLSIFDPATLSGLVAQFKSDVQQPAFWLSVGKIIWINVLLSGDNALVIALACRGLNAQHRLWGMILGAGAAVFLRIIFTGIVATLMEWPYLKLVGGLALLVIAAKLLVPENDDEDSVQSGKHLWHAVQIVVVADIVMSLDNVIAVAAAANGSVPLLILGLAISVPMIVAGAALIMLVLEKLPLLVWLGAALLGWVAGEVIATDPAIHPLMMTFDGPGAQIDRLFRTVGLATDFAVPGNVGEYLFALCGAVLVLVAGAIWRRISLGGDEAAKPT